MWRINALLRGCSDMRATSSLPVHSLLLLFRPERMIICAFAQAVVGAVCLKASESLWRKTRTTMVEAVHMPIVESPGYLADEESSPSVSAVSWLSSSVSALADLAPRIRTGCVYDLQPRRTCGVLVTREAPRRARRVRASIHAHWRWFAPSINLLTGHSDACRHRQCRHDDASPAEHRSGHRCNALPPRQQLGWDGFATAYRAELERWPRLAHVAVAQQIARWLQTFETVTILSFESSTPRGAALTAWEESGEFRPYTQRHIFREWLLME